MHKYFITIKQTIFNNSSQGNFLLPSSQLKNFTNTLEINFSLTTKRLLIIQNNKKKTMQIPFFFNSGTFSKISVKS